MANYKSKFTGASIDARIEKVDQLITELTDLRDRLKAIIGENDTTSKIDTLNEVNQFLSGFDGSEKLSDVINSAHKEMSDDEYNEIRNLIK